MEQFKPGQRVHVEYDGVVTRGHGGLIVIEDAKGDNHYYYTAEAKLTVTLADPENWPPQVGDIWEADGKEWITRCKSTGDYGLYLAPIDQTVTLSVFNTDELDEFKALNPVLVRRRGQ